MTKLVTTLAILAVSFSVFTKAEASCGAIKASATQILTLEPQLKTALLNMKLAHGPEGQAKNRSNAQVLTQALMEASNKVISALHCHANEGTIRFLVNPDEYQKKITEVTQLKRQLDGGYVLNAETATTVDDAYEALRLATLATGLIENLELVAK